MTDMKRITISLPADIDKRIIELKKTDKFARSSYAEVLRAVLYAGLKAKKGII